MHLQIVKGDGRTIEVTSSMAFAVLVLFGLVTFGAWETDHDLYKTLAQGLLNITIGVAGFYFGSSNGSQKKDETIATALNPTEPPK